MDVTLTAETGRTLGSRPSRRLRAEGKVPGVVYGLGADPVPVAVPWPDLRRVLTTEAGLNALIELTVDGERNLTIVKELQRDPVRRDVTHVDFIRVDASADLEVEVPIVLVGEAEKLGHEGGLIDQVLHELLIKAKPDAIPNEVELDITELTAGHSLRVADIRLPDGVTTDVDPEDPVALGYVPRVDAAAEEGEAVEGEGEGEGEAEAPAGGEPAEGETGGDAGDADGE
jgi:large subunit ribosomal protein L25